MDNLKRPVNTIAFIIGCNKRDQPLLNINVPVAPVNYILELEAK